jgi:hypothetical protein
MDLGRRSWFLILFSLAYLGIGYGSYIQTLGRQPLFIHELFPAWVRGAIWVLGACLAFYGAFMRSYPKWETAGFVGLCVPMAIRVVSYIMGALYAVEAPQEFRYTLVTLGLTGFFTFGVVLIAIMLVASWPEPHPVFLRKPPKKKKADNQ